MDNETAAWQLEFVAKPDLPKWVICSYSTNSNSTSRDVGAFLRPKKRGPSYANWGDVEGEEEEEQGEEGRRKITYSGSLYVGSMGWEKHWPRGIWRNFFFSLNSVSKTLLPGKTNYFS